MNARAGLIVLQSLLLLEAITFAAAVSCARGDNMGRSSYKQSYRVPIQAAVAPIRPGIYNDEFTAQKPINADDPSFVDLGSKWSPYDFGDALEMGAINPRMRMCTLVSGGEKVWNGVRQDLPLPAVGAPVAYAVYGRGVNSAIGTTGDFDGYFFGMLFCEDADDDANQLYSIVTSLVRGDGVIFGGTEAMLWPSYDALAPEPDGEMSVGWPAEYWRAIIQSSQDSEGAYTTSIQLQASVSGIGFQTLARYQNLDFPFRQLILGQRTTLNVQMTALFDYVRLFTDVIEIDTTGRIQQLGST